MMAVVRNRRALITGVTPYDGDQHGRTHLVDVDYTDGLGAESDTLLWEVEPGTDLVEPSSLPDVAGSAPMDPREYDAMVRAARWSAITPSLPFSGLDEDRPPVAAPLFGAVHPEAYQLVPVLRALEMPRVALLLADAVGLGKTIQAGMVLRELMLRRRIRRVLVLCPASLRTQWRDEMAEKFSLPFEVVDRPATLRLQKEVGLDANPWRSYERVIASYHYLKQPDVLEAFRVTAEPSADASGGRLRWDLLIVDEAHNCAPSSFGDDSDLARLIQHIAPWFEHRVFLTATPHNGHTRSFSGLLEALDPVRFTRKSELDEEDKRRVSETVIRRLKSDINGAYKAMGEAPRFSERIVEALPVLHFGKQERELQEAFRDFRKALVRATKGAAKREQTAAAFAVEILQKRLLSGPWAFGQSWLNLIEGLESRAFTPDEPATASTDLVLRAKDLQDEEAESDPERESRHRLADKALGGWLVSFAPAVKDELTAVSATIAALGVTRVAVGLEREAQTEAVAVAAVKVKADARMKALEAFVGTHLRDPSGWRSDERVVIFTEYLATLDYLKARLEKAYGAGPWLVRLFGGLNDEARDQVKRAFNDPKSEARVLLATDAAGEGLNLQRAARYLLHWDIPWNPGKMEQRNGRVDRHGQERDVHILHFDATDDASMRFLGKVLLKRSQTREDNVVTDDIFASALLAHFEHDEDVEVVEQRLDTAIKNAKAQTGGSEDDIPESAALPGQADAERLDRLRAELDLSPTALRDTLETTFAIGSGRPRLESDGHGRDRLVRPIPAAFVDLVKDTLTVETIRGEKNPPTVALVFDPAHYIHERSGRPVYIPEPDSRLLHLGHAIYHRILGTFARYRFPGGPKAGTRWTVRATDTQEPLVLLTVEELGLNELREPCHHWVETLAFPFRADALAPLLEPRAAADWASDVTQVGDAARARAIWDDVDRELKAFVDLRRQTLTTSLRERLKTSGERVRAFETKRFERRAKELEKAQRDNVLEKLKKEGDKLRAQQRQRSLFQDIDQELARKIADLDAEMALRRSHYQGVQLRLADEQKRVLTEVLPKRYKLRGEAFVYPIAVEIRLPGVGR